MEKPIASRITFFVLILLSVLCTGLGTYFDVYTKNENGKFLFNTFAMLFALASAVFFYQREHQVVAFLNKLENDKVLEVTYAIFLLKTYQEQSPWINLIIKKIEKDLKDECFRDSFYSRLKKEEGLISQKDHLLTLCSVKDFLQDR